MNPDNLKQSWAVVAASGDQVPLFFYSTLFLMHPETRNLFPIGMAAQRDKLVTALGHVVSNVDKVDDLVPFLQQLGRDHRKFSVTADHYPAVGAALLATLAHFLGPQWTPELSAEWEEAYTLVAQVMSGAADDAANSSPPWWDAEVVAHERRALDIAVITIRPNYGFEFSPGQSITLESPLRPRLWRFYSPANLPRPDRTIELHVRAVPGGPVSSALVLATHVGDILRLGPPMGHRLTLDSSVGLDLLLIAGGTGLAPFKALIEQAALNGGRRVCLVHGARTALELYDMEALNKLASMHSWLTVVPAISDDPLYRGDKYTAVDAALRLDRWSSAAVYVCGSPEMVAGTVPALEKGGISAERIHIEQFVSGQYTSSAMAATATAAGGST